MHSSGAISIWFFIGVLLTAYGILIGASGIYELYHPQAHPVVLAELHAGIWWGALLLLIGLFYTLKFFPKKR
jgi:divalent metal cation (Fe/Co/Zn/Cd) transporter